MISKVRKVKLFEDKRKNYFFLKKKIIEGKVRQGEKSGFIYLTKIEIIKIISASKSLKLSMHRNH